MSHRNGDRARADKKRTAKIHDRTRIREFRATLDLPKIPKESKSS